MSLKDKLWFNIGMKLFLASSLDKTIDLLKTHLPKTASRVVFIANAADRYKGDKWWVESDRKAFEKIGCILLPVDIKEMTSEKFSELLDQADIIHFCGGSVLYLMGLIKEKGLGSLITSFVKKGGLYTGTSAGSMIAASDLKLCVADPEEKEYMDVNTVTDYSGLGLVDFLIIPHCNNADFVAGNKEMVELMPKNSKPLPLIWIYDSEVVLVDEGKFEILTA